jgi:hypothetical protein
MSYIINKSDGSILLSVQDGTVDTSLSIALVGKNYVGYGEIQNENFVYLLENFAGPNPPSRPLSGQTWYDSENQIFNFYNGTSWFPVGAASSSDEAPEGVPGAFWFKTDSKQLYIFVDEITGWQLIGPEAIPGFGKTKVEARVLRDLDGRDHAGLLIIVDDEILGICVNENFEINLFPGFRTLSKGINLSSTVAFSGNINGNSSTTSKLQDAVLINGIAFDGSEDITITSSTSNPLIKGSYITGSNFDGSSAVTWAVDATPANITGKVVVRDSKGDFSANDITANNFIGTLKGNVDIDTGISYFRKIVCDDIEPRRFSGTASAASKLLPGRNINGVLFDGSIDITVPASAETLTGLRISENVVDSSLRTVGILNSLNVKKEGIVVGENPSLKVYVENEQPLIESQTATGLQIKIKDEIGIGLSTSIFFLPSLLAEGNPALIPQVNASINLGLPNQQFLNVYANLFRGEATSAQYADLAENYLADSLYAPGTVLEFGGDYEVTIAPQFSNKIAGVVSTKPAHLMNSEAQGDYVVPLALQGRVPCKVRGRISKGDMLVSAGNGYAEACKSPEIGTVIGKSLENFDGEHGVIEIAVGRL